MHFHLPKPLHGWREFGGEVGIIVLGVLIALSAEQVVESIHSRQEVRDTRKALDAELSRDLGAYAFRVSERGCAQARVDELERWAKSMAEGQPLTLTKEVMQPIFFSINTSVWQATNGDAAARMPLEPKLAYAALYDAMRTYDEVARNEADSWTTVGDYAGSTDLTREELHQVHHALLDLRADDQMLDVFGSRFGEFAAKLNIRPKEHIERGVGFRIDPAVRELCQPLL
jgi:hypothetical protein